MSSAISAARRTIVAGKTRLLPELLADLGLDPAADRATVFHVEEARAELADESQVDPVLQLRERVDRAAVTVPIAVRQECRRSVRRARDPLVQLHC
jgi:hypothetical protein